MEQDVPGSTHMSDTFKSLNPKDLNPDPFLAHHPREPERPRSSHILTEEDPIFFWIGDRVGQINGLRLTVNLHELYAVARQCCKYNRLEFDQLGVEDPLQVLHSIPNTRVIAGAYLGTMDVFWSQRLRQHGRLLDCINAEIDGDMQELPLQEACQSIAAVKTIYLNVNHGTDGAVSLNSLLSLRESLVRLGLDGRDLSGHGPQEAPTLDGWVNISSFGHLTSLTVKKYELTCADPWAPLAALSSLEKLRLLKVSAHGPGASLSALTGLTHLEISGSKEAEDVEGGVEAAAGPPAFALSSLQPLSTLQALEELWLYSSALAATSLAGLAGLSSLQDLRLSHCKELVSYEGVSTAITYLSLSYGPFPCGLHGLSSLVQLKKLELKCCGITSLEELPSTGLSSLKCLQLSEHDTGAWGDYDYHAAVDGFPGPTLVSLSGIEGLSSSLKSLVLEDLEELESIDGVEKLHGLKQLKLESCGVTSLKPLAELRAGRLWSLDIECCEDVQEEVLELPHIPYTRYTNIRRSNIREVVFAGGVKEEITR